MAGMFLFLGNNPIVDFVNTEKNRNGGVIDLISDFADFSEWCNQSGLYTADIAIVEPLKQEKILCELREFRAELRNFFVKIVNGEKANTPFLDKVNLVLSRSCLKMELNFADKGFSTTILPDTKSDHFFLAILAIQTANLIASGNLSSLRKCRSEDCILFFLDFSKNHTRRWCNMKTCGNRAKVNAYLYRQSDNN